MKVLLSRKTNIDLSPRRIEVLPIKVIASLVELGVHPHAIGVHNIVERRLVAWNTAEPTCENTPPAAHIERPSLENELLKLASRQDRIELCVTDARSAKVEAIAHAQSGMCVIDATGRRASLASRKSCPKRQWVARIFHVARESTQLVDPFMVTALPFGYVYRAAGQHFCTVGVVGYGRLLAGSSVHVSERLRKSGANWMLEDIAALQWTLAGCKPASLQWASGEAVTLIGDAALARDALSSQGLASGLADTRYAAAMRTPEDRRAIAERSQLARIAHAKSLISIVSTCRWRDEPVWREYLDFLVGPAQTKNVQANGCLAQTGSDQSAAKEGARKA